MSVPRLPPLDAALVEQHAAAHQGLTAHYRSVDEAVRIAFRSLQHRLVVESLAYVQPVLNRPLDQLLRPPPRAFLTRTQELRLDGARAAFRHLDSRAAMLRQGAVTSVLDPTTPVVLHALLEGPTPSGRETNAGMLRATPTAWRPESNSFMHPPAGMCVDLVAEAIDLARTSTAPACVRAAWLTFTMLSIHPFVDGNGRTSRALYMAVVADELGLGVDWGIAEQWSAARFHYVDALQAGQRVEKYDGSAMDAAAFVEFSTQASIVGVELCRRRLDLIDAELEGLRNAGLSAHAAVVLNTVRTSLISSPTELSLLGFSAGDLDQAIAELVSTGRVAWQRRPASRLTLADTAVFGLCSVEDPSV